MTDDDFERIERTLLLDALDEDAVLSAAERVAETEDLSVAEAVERCLALAERGLLSFYRYAPDGAFADVAPGTLSAALRASPYEIFMTSTAGTFERLHALDGSEGKIA